MSTSASRLDGLDCAPYFQRVGMAADDRSKLLGLLAKHAYDYKKGAYKLASGKVSDEYIDCKMALSQVGAIVPLGNLVLSHIYPPVVAIGGLTMGADPIAYATCFAAELSGRGLRSFSVRKSAKEHGLRKMIEGAVVEGDNIAVVDDVVTRGGSTIEAIEKCRDHGLNLIQVIILVDREEDDGLQKVKDRAGAGVDVIALFTKSMIHQEWLRQSLRATA